jgi:hypothetical protein
LNRYATRHNAAIRIRIVFVDMGAISPTVDPTY